jgi:hypothetical protein
MINPPITTSGAAIVNAKTALLAKAVGGRGGIVG